MADSNHHNLVLFESNIPRMQFNPRKPILQLVLIFRWAATASPRMGFSTNSSPGRSSSSYPCKVDHSPRTLLARIPWAKEVVYPPHFPGFWRGVLSSVLGRSSFSPCVGHNKRRAPSSTSSFPLPHGQISMKSHHADYSREKGRSTSAGEHHAGKQQARAVVERCRPLQVEFHALLPDVQRVHPGL